MGWIQGRGVLTALALVAMLFVFGGCGGGDDGSDLAHVNEGSGSTNDLPFDERDGTPPPPVKETDLVKAADEAGCYLLLKLPEEGNKEVPPGSPVPKYERDPPTSGTHVEAPYQQADGAYMLQAEPLEGVAALDHGRMEIQYAPDLSEEIQLKLKGLYDTMYGGTLFFPNSTMRYAVAATTWNGFLACGAWRDDETLDAIRAFGKATWGKRGNEPVENFPVEGPTPRDPEEPDAS
jgi:hypothetical protein